MLIDKQTNVVAPLGDATTFSIDPESTAFIIEMLSSKLYEQPVLAMVRETITNAIDAHQSANKPHQPIEITVTGADTDTALQYSVADAGLGMSPDCINNVLAKLGKSSKSDSNLSHGGYGIGILSVFAVAQSATIVTIWEGVMYEYQLKLSGGIPAISLNWSGPEQHGNIGTKITVPVPVDHHYDLKLAIDWYDRMLTPAPKVKLIPADLGFRTVVYSQNSLVDVGWELLNLDQRRHSNDTIPTDLRDLRVVVRIGQIPYALSYDLLHSVNELCAADPSINNDLIDIVCESALTNHRLSRPTIGLYLILNLPIGVFDLPGSRENILDTPNNAKLILDAICQAVPALHAKLIEAIASDDVSLEVKADVASRWYLGSFWYEGQAYSTKQLNTKILMTRIQSRHGRQMSIVSLDTYHNLICSKEDLAVLITTRKILPSLVNRLVKQYWGGEADYHDKYFYILADRLDYDVQMLNEPLFALVFKDAPVLVDPGPAPKRTPSVSYVERKHARILKAKEGVKYIPSLQALGKQLVNDEIDVERLSFEPMTGDFPTDKFYYLPLALQARMSIYAYARLCYRLNIDTDLYICSEDVQKVLDYIRPDSLVMIPEFIDLALEPLVKDRVWAPLELGWFPGLNNANGGTGHFYPRLFSDRNERLTIFLTALTGPFGNSGIPTPRQTSLIANYLLDLDIWTLLVESGLYLGLTRSYHACEQDFVPYQSDDKLRLTLAKLLEPATSVLSGFARFDLELSDPEQLETLLAAILAITKLIS